MKTLDRVVVIFGLAGAGKSTLANGMGESLGLRVIHPSGIMRDLLERQEVNLANTRHNDGFWETDEGVQILRERLHQARPIDVEANDILLQEVEKGQVVIDSWSLPWMSDRGWKLHLKADLPIRAERAAKRAGISYQQALQRISEKDEQTRLLFLRLYGFDIKIDHEVFHHTLDAHLSEAEVLSLALQAYNHWSASLESAHPIVSLRSEPQR